MSATIRLAALCAAWGLLTTQSMASTRVGVFAIVDDVSFEPSDFEPDRVWISGVFVVPVPISSGRHQAVSRGHLYFSVNPDAPLSTRQDWQALRDVAGTGRAVGFGQYWMPCSKSRIADFPVARVPPESNCALEVRIYADRSLASAAAAEPYPEPSHEGVVTEFNTHGDVCPRFGPPSAEIVAALREAYRPGSPREEPSLCVERIGLVSSSSLEAAFLTQTRDTEWAEATETLILDRLARAPGLELSGLVVECRDTICHIDLTFPTREYQETTGDRLVADALHEMPGFAPGGAIIPARDQPTSEYYLQRRAGVDAPAAHEASSP